MRSRRRLTAEDDGLSHVWPSFTDVTATIAIIFMVLMLLAYIRNLISGQEVIAYQAQIARSEERLRVLSLDLERTGREIATGRARLAVSEGELAQQRAVIVENTRELENLRATLSSISVLRVEVLNKVKAALEAGLVGSNVGGPGAGAGAASLVRIGDNGNIIINEGLVFEFNSFAIKPEGKKLLGDLGRALLSTLEDETVREYVDTIVVQGHTDDRGSSAFNRDLSAKRANAVLDYLLEITPGLEQNYGSYFAASAFSEFRPLDKNESESAYERNRRIEISVVLRDTTIPKLIEQYVHSVGAGPGAGAPAGAPAAPGAGAPAGGN
jgi:chemotaxis protein MotB